MCAKFILCCCTVFLSLPVVAHARPDILTLSNAAKIEELQWEVANFPGEKNWAEYIVKSIFHPEETYAKGESAQATVLRLAYAAKTPALARTVALILSLDRIEQNDFVRVRDFQQTLHDGFMRLDNPEAIDEARRSFRRASELTSIPLTETVQRASLGRHPSCERLFDPL